MSAPRVRSDVERIRVPICWAVDDQRDLLALAAVTPSTAARRDQPPLEDRPPQLAVDLAAEISAADEADVES